MKRVLLISDHASPLAVCGSVDCGGQNVYVAQLARHLSRLGFLVDVATRQDQPHQPPVFEWLPGVRILHITAGPAEYIRKEKLLAYMPEFAARCVEVAKRERYDLVHANFFMSGIAAMEIKRLLGIPFVITFHALGRVRRHHQGDADGFPEVRFAVEDEIVREANLIIAECPQDRADLETLYPAVPERITVIPCGFDSHEISPVPKHEARKVLQLNHNEFIILQLGRMVPRKGVDNVIHGLSVLTRRHGASATLLVVGGESASPDDLANPEIRRLKTIAEEEGVTERVRFVGRRDREQLKYYYSAADVFVSTPWYEPFGITPVEAMACGTPVIGSSVEGIKETVQHGITGFLVSPRDPDALAEKLALLHHNPSIVLELGRNAIARANRYYTWEQVAESVAYNYHRTIAIQTGRQRQLVELPPLIIERTPRRHRATVQWTHRVDSRLRAGGAK